MKQGISEKKMPHKIMNCKHTFNYTKHFFEGLYIYIYTQNQFITPKLA
jgi:hypothetical protein